MPDKNFLLSLCVAGTVAAGGTSVVYESVPYWMEQSIDLENYQVYSGVSQSATVELLENLEKLESFLNLPENWNGNGAKPFSFELINYVIEILCRLPKQPQIFPTAENSIQLEYDNPDGSYLEIEVFEDVIQVFFLDKNKREYEFKTNTCDYNSLRRVVGQYCA